MSVVFHAYDQEFVNALRSGGVDAHGLKAERAVSDGVGTPCRSCLHDVPEGADMLIAAARPFPKPQPYAEVGPVFFCADDCTPWDGAGVPPIMTTSPDYLLKGYSADNRIVYGTGKIVEVGALTEYAAEVLSNDKVAYVDVRSARNNCFQTRITTIP